MNSKILFKRDVIVCSMLFLVYSSKFWIVCKQTSNLASPLSASFLDTQFRLMSSLECKALCIITNSLTFSSTCRSSSLVNFGNDPENLTMRTPRYLFVSGNHCCGDLFRKSFLFFWGSAFLLFLLSVCKRLFAFNIPRYIEYFYGSILMRSWCGRSVLSLVSTLFFSSW